ncbi:ribosome maturation factor RimP [Schleiferilactobacillus shenzhenensis]|uniref:Ribosome maturation factor RimP n=1 Tax=Schleiferilactobacillus shenzhenensis LY-73 TaxID=1231336 RepID=U4TM63_9LACO|nr:ribosome maturation factor RimP [Schleiferilactobacillus shenzhenensis]ERL64495.1 RimP [Schleiferilactobacillus shenzhenensis LY-73]
MAKQSIVETVTPLIAPIVTAAGLQLVDVEYVKEGKNWYLRVYVDKQGGIDVEEIAKVSDPISTALDGLSPDPFPDTYVLEVSSPGAERPLKTAADLQQAVGDYIHISLYEPVDGQKVFEGTLQTLTDKELTLLTKVKTRRIPRTFARDAIAHARLAIEF